MYRTINHYITSFKINIMSLPQSVKELRNFPRAAPYIIGNEFAERFSFYGMKALLATFLMQQFHFSEARSNEVTHLFVSQAYLFSILGAFLADWFWGKYLTIFRLSLIYCLGHLCLALSDQHPTGFQLGLFLIALGAGGIKPCVSANVGDQFDETNRHLLPRLYEVFYFSINTGALISMLLTPWLYHRFGASVAFGVPGLLMGLATFIFWMGKPHYQNAPPSGMPKVFFLQILLYPLIPFLKGNRDTGYIQTSAQRFGKEKTEEAIAVLKACVVFIFLPIFWALYDQNGSEWVLQAQKMDRQFMGIEWLTEQVQSINAFLILILVPFFSLILFPYIEKKGTSISPLLKMGTGFVFTFFSFVIIALAQEKIDTGLRTSIGYQVLAYTILTIGEILVYMTGLEYAYRQAPANQKSTVMALFLLTVAGGNYLVTLLNRNIENKGIFSQLNGADYFWFFTALMGISTLFFFFLRGKMEKKSID